MRTFLDDFIRSLTSHRQERVISILEETRVGKGDLDTISDKLLGLGQFFPLTIDGETAGSILSASSMHVKFIDIRNSLGILFDASNYISLLLDSHAAILSSEVKALEDQLNALEKLVLNYSFTLADGGSYNYAYLETFSDENGRDNFDWLIPDRARQVFGPAEQAIVRTDEGVLALAEEPIGNTPLRATVVQGNALSLVSGDTGIGNAVSSSSTTGWKLNISSPNPITSSLSSDLDESGAQVLVEFVLDQVAPCSQLKIVPVADRDVHLLKATLFKDHNDSSSVELLSTTRVLDRPTTLHFPLQSVARFRLLLSQPVYYRVAEQVHIPEQEYNQIQNVVPVPSPIIKRGRHHQKGQHFGDNVEDNNSIQGDSISLLLKEKGIASIPNELPFTHYHPNFGALNLKEALVEINSRNYFYLWDRYDPLAIHMWKLFRLRFYHWDHWDDLWKRVIRYKPKPVEIIPPPSQPTPPTPVSVQPPGFNYQYNLGLQNVAIGNDSPGFKGVFVSKSLPAPGDIGEIKLKVAETNYALPNTNRNMPWLTSIEYSVSDTSRPNDESQWIPILPSGTDTVVCETFFPDETGKGYFRFPANPLLSTYLYCNGYIVDARNIMYDDAHQAIIGFQILTGVNAVDNYTCSYTPVGDKTIVNFESSGFQNKPVVSAFDDTGAGEGFLQTSDRNTITLAYTPYIDYDQVLTSTYSTQFGLTPYQPINILLSGGITPINLTDYINHSENAMPETGYYYIQSGPFIMFNRAITQSFRVYYQYLQNDVRFRVVMRVNDKNFVSPTVDYVHAKTRARKQDPGDTF